VSPKFPFDLIDIDGAARLSARLASSGPLDRSYLLEGLDEHLQSLAEEAAPLIERETGFIVERTPVARVMTRTEWAVGNIDSMVGLMGPLLERIDQRVRSAPGGDLAKLAYRPAIGLQLGAILGLLSHRVLGQYDVLMSATDEIWFVGTNMVLMERRLGFVPRDFRLWVVIHEATHRAQFLGNPWLRDHFLSLVRDLFESIDLDPRSFVERIREALRNPATDMPIAILSPSHRQKFDRLQAFMSVIEGHGNFVMDRLAEGRIPTQPRMKRALQDRAASERPLAKLLRRLLGLDLKRLQYEEGQRFFQGLAEQGGLEAVRSCFASAESLPTIDEIRDPARWLMRAGV
jgi:coenzyme F420 biosynthesis associated uncharacterized protein